MAKTGQRTIKRLFVPPIPQIEPNINFKMAVLIRLMKAKKITNGGKISRAPTRKGLASNDFGA